MILNRGPELTGTIENKTVLLNSPLIYNLPVIDPENQPLVLRMNAIQTVQDFTTINSTSIWFAPTLYNHIGTFKIDAEIIDSFGLNVKF